MASLPPDRGHPISIKWRDRPKDALPILKIYILVPVCKRQIYTTTAGVLPRAPNETPDCISLPLQPIYGVGVAQ